MSETLYRKYRPQTYADIHEQEHIKTTLQNEVARGTIAHGYVFSGPRGVGKTTTARIFAKSLNCKNLKGVEPCNACQNCTEITEGRSMDVVEIDAASHSGVDNVRERIIEAVRFAPVNGKWKIFIIDEAHMLSTAAWNALLKTLEEPPSHAVFILASTELHKFPETILSRCQRFEFKKLKPTELLAKLKTIVEREKVKVDEDVLRAVVRKSEGGMRDAESLLGQILALGGDDITVAAASVFLPTTASRTIVEFLTLLAQKKTADALRFVAKLVDGGSDLPAFVAETVAALRLALISRATSDWTHVEEAFDTVSSDELKKEFGALSESQIVRMLELLIKAAREVKSADISQLPLEMAIVSLATDEAPPVRQEPPRSAPPSNFSAPAQSSSHPMPPMMRPPMNAKSTIPQVPESRPQATPSSLTKSLGEYQAKWNQVIEKVSATSASLPFILKLATPMEISGNEIRLAFQYPFHADTYNKDVNRRTVEAAWLAIMGESCLCVGVAVPRPVPNDALGEVSPVNTISLPKVDEKMKSVLDDFGGKIVAS
jgi:DNA polymerase-3 subunit gamma/tau